MAKARRLSDLRPGESGTIRKVAGAGRFKRRLLEMGFVPGERVSMEKFAPLRDPGEYVIKGYHVSLRREEAEMVLLEGEGS